jgi:hypothetical protein
LDRWLIFALPVALLKRPLLTRTTIISYIIFAFPITWNWVLFLPRIGISLRQKTLNYLGYSVELFQRQELQPMSQLLFDERRSITAAVAKMESDLPAHLLTQTVRSSSIAFIVLRKD